MDSYGNSAQTYLLPKTDRFNKIVLQGKNSVVCGQYCIMYILYMSRGKTMEDFKRVFTDDLERNDHYVASFINNIFQVKFPVHI